MKRFLVSAAMLLLGAAAILATFEARWRPGDPARPLVATCGTTLLVAAAVTFASGASRGRSAAALRWDHFLPFLRKPRKNAAPRTPSAAWRTLARVLPAGWLSDPATAKPGRFRRWAKWIGPTVVAAPFRRAIQCLCFGAFLFLFHYVCWSYTSLPAPPPRRWAGVEILAVYLNSGHIRLVATTTP